MPGVVDRLATAERKRMLGDNTPNRRILIGAYNEAARTISSALQGDPAAAWLYELAARNDNLELFLALSLWGTASSGRLATFRRKIGWRWLLDRIDWFAENCKIGRIWVDVGCDH
jgi:hypothetical protein